MLIYPVVMCPRCCAEAGQPCHDANGLPFKQGAYHIERIALFLERPR